jgi:hypothetical protein
MMSISGRLNPGTKHITKEPAVATDYNKETEKEV